MRAGFNFIAKTNQEVADTILASFRLAEDHQVMMPVLVCQDAFVLSHTMMMTDFPDQDDVDAFLPTLDLPHRLTHVPRTMGGLAFPHETESHRRQQQEAMGRVPSVYAQVQHEFKAAFGRELADAVVPYRLDDADMVLVSMGTTASTVLAAVDHARDKGIKVGSLRLRMFRPFPETELLSFLDGVKRVGVIDRNLCPGMGGILWSELRGLVSRDNTVQDYIIGLGGGDIRPDHVSSIIEDLGSRTTAGAPKILEAV